MLNRKNREHNLYDWFHQKEQLSALTDNYNLGYFTSFTILRVLFFAVTCFKVKAEKSSIVCQIQHRNT